MKIISMCVAAIAVFFIFSTPASSAPAAAKKSPYPTNTCGAENVGMPFRIVGFKNYPPFSWSEMDEQYYKDTGYKRYMYQGFVLDPLKQALNDIHVVRIQDIAFDDFNDALKAMLHGKADLLFTGYYVDESKSGLDYIYPAYFGNPFIVLSRKSKKIDVEDVSELKGMKGVVRREEEVASLIRGLLPTDTKLEVVDGPEAAFRMLLSGNADFMITSPYAADAEAKRFKIKDKLHFGSKVVRHIKYFMAFSKMSICRPYKDIFSQKFNERFKNKAEIEKLIHKYIDIWVELHADEPPLEYTPAADDQPAPAAAAQQPMAHAG
ncbi:MAG: transporter substrate-binding domain-containing protein [Alphaproteobacteria bacterium]|nr:transporter substrate-binding domain-containing protein [Alphaproteobacteria bacterium]